MVKFSDRSASFPISLSVPAERTYTLLVSLNNLESNICTFFLWAASLQHLAKKKKKLLEAGRFYI